MNVHETAPKAAVLSGNTVSLKDALNTDALTTDGTTKDFSIKDAAMSYVQLTKPTIMLLVVFSGAVALFMEGSLLTKPFEALAILLAVYLTGGAANALNQYFERDIDAKMSRTKTRRPLPQEKMTPNQALVFIITIAVAGLLIFGLMFNWLSAALSLGTILFYGFFYTLWLKPNTPQNIVIGGAAGAMAPIGVWAAITGSVSIEAYLLFAIVFFWTPPHFWALAMFCKDDYIKVGLPMMPVVKGDRETLKQIFIYTLITVATTITLAAVFGGWVFWISSILLGAFFTKIVWGAREHHSKDEMRKVFAYSIVYLFALFLALMADSVIFKVMGARAETLARLFY
jgi:heme o synthase